jgi:fucose permease
MEDKGLPADRKKQRLLIALFFFISGILSATWSSRIPDIQQKLGLSNAALGTVLSAIPVGLVTGLSFASWAVASFGAKRVVVVSTLFLTLFLSLAGIASSSLLLMMMLFLLGISRTLLNLSANAGAIEVQQLYNRPIIASFHGIWSLACFVAAGISTVIIILDVRPVWHFSGIAIAVALTVLLCFKKEKAQQQNIERRPFFVKPDRYLFLLGLMALCSMLCEGAMFDWSVNYFENVVHAGKSYVTTGYIAFIVTMAAGRLAGDRFIYLFGVYRVLAVCGLLMAAGFAVAALFPFALPAAIGFALIGMGDSVLVPVIYLLASKSQKMPASYALSSVTLVGYAGFLLGPLLIGNVSDNWGMPTAFGALTFVSLLIILLSLQVKRQPHEDGFTGI